MVAHYPVDGEFNELPAWYGDLERMFLSPIIYSSSGQHAGTQLLAPSSQT